MRVTVKETVTRFHTIDVDDEFDGMDSSELEECEDIREKMWDSIAINGWMDEYVHECTFSVGVAPDTIYYRD